MIRKESSDLLCAVCAAPATQRIDAHPVCDTCAENTDTKEYLKRLTKFE